MCAVATSLISVMVWLPATSPGEQGECNDTYEIAAAVAVPILPPALRELLELNSGAFQKAAAPGAYFSSGSKVTTGERQWHYVWLDIDGGAGTIDQRREAAKCFPREREKARALYESRHMPGGGLLPWVVEDRYEDLVQAFRLGDAEKIAAEAGALLHFAVDAALPFNTTMIFSSPGFRPAPPPEHPLTRMQNRYHNDLIQRLRKQLDFEVRVSPDRIRPVESVLDATFDALLKAHWAADELIAIEASEACLEKLAERAAPILETQIEAGALLSANLIVAAWTQAGKPELKTATAAQRVAASHQAVAVSYVGSRNSTVYHRSDCAHVARIKAENRVTFESADKARAAGRTPCQTCKPDAAEKPPPR